MKSDTIIIIAARDSYSETWDAFFSLFFKYWPDCPYPVYLFTEKKTYPDPRILPLVVSDDPNGSWGKQWADRIRKALAEVDASYFILLHTDYFFSEKIDTARIAGLIELIRRSDVGYIRLCPVPPPKLPYSGDRTLGTLSKRDAYNVSLQAGLWKRSVFERFLISGLNPGEFEIEGSKNSYKVKETFLCTKKGLAAIPYVHGISKAAWLYEARRFLKNEGHEVRTTRNKESFWAYICRVYYINMIKYRLKMLWCHL
ncbi:MAG: hypothetical protein NT077_01045 [Candidatus Taylorbacteria bacterium]|nr:hypothetical protein [Candidatus Taylorbacteria bacterium]